MAFLIITPSFKEFHAYVLYPFYTIKQNKLKFILLCKYIGKQTFYLQLDVGSVVAFDGPVILHVLCCWRSLEPNFHFFGHTCLCCF